MNYPGEGGGRKRERDVEDLERTILRVGERRVIECYRIVTRNCNVGSGLFRRLYRRNKFNDP